MVKIDEDALGYRETIQTCSHFGNGKGVGSIQKIS